MTEPNTSCPIDYRYSLTELASAPNRSVQALYVVGGLYGNVEALRSLSSVLSREAGAEVVFNGDFNWLNVDDDSYVQINEFVLAHTALRGNVETELDQPLSRGCGCDYPDWVSNGVKARSDEIISDLKITAQRNRNLTRRFRELPRYLVYTIGGRRVGVVHGDAQSLSGWGFAQENLSDPEHTEQVKSWFTGSNIEIFACSHTCLPVMMRFELEQGSGWIVNNGSAGMPNFSGTRYGVITRIGVQPCSSIKPLYGVQHHGLHIDAIAIEYDCARWSARFTANWPEGSTAHASYYSRFSDGPDYRLEQALRE